MITSDLLNLDNPILKTFLFYGSILVAKMLAMSVLTARKRYEKGVFISPEDTKLKKGGKVAPDGDVERIRRAHMNDIENIPVFLISGFIYILTDPSPVIAINLFRVYAICRIIHTYIYAIHVIPQPARATVWGIAYGINWYMVGASAYKFISV